MDFRILIAGALGLTLAACETGGKETDLNSVVPKLMKDLTGPRPEESAKQLFNTTSPDERRDAIAHLCQQKYGHEAPYMKAYEMLATDPHPMVRAQAMKALAGAKSPAVVPRLLKGLEDKDAMVREDAAAGLVESFSEDAIEPLLAHLKADESVQVRMHCARALANTSKPAALRGLIDALDDRNVGVVHFAHASLQRITGQSLTADSRQWLEWYNNQAWATKGKG